MSRRNRAKPRLIEPDPVYGSVIIAELVNSVMKNGKKLIAQKIVYEAIDIMDQKLKNGQFAIQNNETAVDAVEVAVTRVMPILEVKPRRVGGANFQVPVEIRKKRSLTLAIRWIVTHSRKKSRGMSIALAGELIDSYNNTGVSIKKREDTHKMAEANKAFAHYKW